MSAELACPKCATSLDCPSSSELARVVCNRCDSILEVTVFPALASPVPVHVGPEPKLDGMEGGCFFHPQSRAQQACETCGRFLCALCDLEIQGEHLCPSCLDSGRHKQNIEMLVQRRLVPDRAAMALAVYPLVLYPLLVITAPLSLFYAIRAFGGPKSPVAEGWRTRAILASVIAVVEILAIVAALSQLVL